MRDRSLNKQTTGPVWHIYLEGDGKAWASRQEVARDPSPSEPLMLQLMAQDTQPALYLGRPCYHGLSTDPACNAWLWTYGRYSPQVVDSLHAALLVLIDEYAIHALIFIGHSGGGSLAMLLAERLPQTRAVITLAGNLDTEAWTTKHAYTPLVGSLNPALRPPLSPRIVQVHYVGDNDHNVPPAMLKTALATQANAELIVLKGVGHRQGWDKKFGVVLNKIKSLGGDND